MSMSMSTSMSIYLSLSLYIYIYIHINHTNDDTHTNTNNNTNHIIPCTGPFHIGGSAIISPTIISEKPLMFVYHISCQLGEIQGCCS